MIEKQVYTIKDLAVILNCNESSIRNMEEDGIIKRNSKLPGVRFNKSDIDKLLKVEMNPMSPMERRKLLKKIEELEERNHLLESAFNAITVDIAKVKVGMYE